MFQNLGKVRASASAAWCCPTTLPFRSEHAGWRVPAPQDGASHRLDGPRIRVKYAMPRDTAHKRQRKSRGVRCAVARSSSRSCARMTRVLALCLERLCGSLPNKARTSEVFHPLHASDAPRSAKRCAEWRQQRPPTAPVHAAPWSPSIS